MSDENSEFLDIDLYSLETELEEQPRKYNKYARKLAKANRDLSLAKAEFKLAKAELGKKIRSVPHDYGLSDKPTVAMVEDTITLDGFCQKCESKVIDCEYTVAVLEAAVKALGQRKDMLVKEVDLFLSGYFARPRPTGEKKRFSNKEQSLKNAIPPKKKPKS